MSLRYLSVCSGIEAATVAWAGLGWKALAYSEIEAFPRAVLSHHYPDTPLHGDFTTLRHAPWIADADLLVGGTPCQAFSIAGLRASLDDARGNLALEFIRLANAIDDLRSDAGRPPAWILWENVPGVFSVADNAFGAFLGGLVGADAPIAPERGKWSHAGVVAGPERVAAWRVLDAQHFGLAQRRRRVFVLARRHPGGWGCADALLPLIDSLRGDPAPRREAGARVARTLAAGTAGSGGHRLDADTAENLIEAFGGNNTQGPIEVTPALLAQPGAGYKGDFESETFITVPEAPRAFPDLAYGFSCKDSGQDAAADLAPTLRAMAEREGNANAGGQIAVAFNWRAGGDQTTLGYDPTETTAAAVVTQDSLAVAFALRGRDDGAVPEVHADGQSVGALRAASGGATRDLVAFDTYNATLDNVAHTLRDGHGEGVPAALTTAAVRRLTPRECERLQGFPDDYTRIDAYLKRLPKDVKVAELAYFMRSDPDMSPMQAMRWATHPDGPRYRALGNSMAVPVMAHIGAAIEAVRKAGGEA